MYASYPWLLHVLFRSLAHVGLRCGWCGGCKKVSSIRRCKRDHGTTACSLDRITDEAWLGQRSRTGKPPKKTHVRHFKFVRACGASDWRRCKQEKRGCRHTQNPEARTQNLETPTASKEKAAGASKTPKPEPQTPETLSSCVRVCASECCEVCASECVRE